MDKYKKKAQSCFKSGKWGLNYDFYKAAFKAASRLTKMMDEADVFAKSGKNDMATDIAMAVAEVIPRNYGDVDDSEGVLGDLFDRAIKLLCDIVKDASTDMIIKKEIYTWSVNESTISDYSDYGFDEIQTIYELCCTLIGDTDEVLVEIERRINEITNEYYKNQAIDWKIRFMKSRNLDVDAVIQSRNKI